MLDPNDDDILISQVRIAVDGETKMPLRVQVFAVSEPSWSSRSATPGQLHPPGGPRVRVQAAAGDQGDRGRADHAAGRPTADERKQAEQKADRRPRHGQGGRHRLEHRGRREQVGDDSARAVSRTQLQGFLASCRGSGDWGSGRLLAGTAFSAVLTDDGRMAVGAVSPRSCTRRSPAERGRRRMIDT